jgi:hypothetical protein
MKQAVSFDPFSLLKKGLTASEVDFNRYEVLPDLIVTPMEAWSENVVRLMG